MPNHHFWFLYLSFRSTHIHQEGIPSTKWLQCSCFCLPSVFIEAQSSTSLQPFFHQFYTSIVPKSCFSIQKSPLFHNNPFDKLCWPFLRVQMFPKMLVQFLQNLHLRSEKPKPRVSTVNQKMVWLAMDSPLKVDTHIMMPEIPLIHFLAKADYAPGNLADEMRWRFIGNPWSDIFWAIEFDLKDFNGWKFQTKKVLHSNSQDFHYISFWLGDVFSRPSMSFWDFSPVSPIISPRLSPIPCLVATNHITREVCGFHRKCWRLSDFLGKKWMFLAHCCYVIVTFEFLQKSFAFFSSLVILWISNELHHCQESALHFWGI